MIALVVIAVWIPLSFGLALVLGRIMRERDRHNSIGRYCRSGLPARYDEIGYHATTKEEPMPLNDALRELLPRKARLVLYVVVSLTLLGVSAYLAAEGDWALFVVTLGGSLQGALAAGNINPPEEAGDGSQLSGD